MNDRPQSIRTFLLLAGLTYFAVGSAVSQTDRRGPESAAAPLPATDAVVYQVDSEQTDIRIFVYRDGPLARLGHNHVISAHDVSGSVAVRHPREESVFELSLAVAELTVDDADVRRVEGDAFSSQPSAADMEGTRNNMLGSRVLDVLRYPTIGVRGRLESAGDSPQVAFSVSLKEHLWQGTLPVTLSIQENELTVEGTLDVSHEDLGLKPFSAMIGALRVADVITLKFRITATRKL